MQEACRVELTCTGLPSQRSRDGYGDRAGLSVWMRMRGFGRCARVRDDRLEVVRKIAADRGGTHATAVAHRALPREDRTGGFAPGLADGNSCQDTVSGAAVAAPWILPIATREALGEMLLLDAAAIAQMLEDGERHRSVVGPIPGGSGHRPRLDERLDE